MHILIISSNYPSTHRPFRQTFVREFVHALSRAGATCSVISPQPVRDAIIHGLETTRDTHIGSITIKLVRPCYLSLGNRRFFGVRTAPLTERMFFLACYRVLKTLGKPPDIVYGHFLYSSGATAVRLATEYNVPSFVGVGESSFWSVKPVGFQKAKEDYRHVSGVIAVNSLIRQNLMDHLEIPGDKIRVFPNGVDLGLFSPMDRLAARKRLGYPINKFIIAFTGSFDNRKGPHRLLEAIKDMHDVGVVFIGKGPIRLNDPRIIFQGTLEHSKIPMALCAADIFVLPTLSEGSCNAIIEAMACGLPIVTSDGEFNDNVVDEQVSIRIDPLDIDGIRDAILRLYHSPGMRAAMSQKAIEKAKGYDINARASAILEWMTQVKATIPG